MIYICLQGKQQFGTVADGNAPVKYPSFKAPKSSFGDGGKLIRTTLFQISFMIDFRSILMSKMAFCFCDADVFPLLVKEAAFPLKEDRGIDTSLVSSF